MSDETRQPRRRPLPAAAPAPTPAPTVYQGDPEVILEGTVARVNYEQGFGFIFCPDGNGPGQEYFFHVSELENLSSIDQVKRGQKARFTGTSSAKGPRATSVTIDT